MKKEFKVKPKLLIVCSSRRRADKISEMLESFDKTKSKETEIVIYVWENDPQIEKYKKVLKDRNVIYGKERTMVEVLNYIPTEVYPGIEYYGEINDDHVYRTKGWDKMLVGVIETLGNGWGISCGKDLVQKDWYKWKHPSGAIISGNIIRALGYFIYPLLKHFYSDKYLKYLGLGIKRLFHIPEVIIEHKCWMEVRKAEEDENTREIHSRMNKDFSSAMYGVWRREQKTKDIKKIKDKMRSEGIKI